MDYSLVDRENELRMVEGFKAKFGEDPTRDELARLYSLAKLAKMNPLVNTFAEIDKGIATITKNYKPRRDYAGIKPETHK